VPVEEGLAPGRVVTSFTSDDGRLHVDLPAELQTWFAWHDGHVKTGREWRAGPLFAQMSAEVSRDWWQRSIAMAVRSAVDGPEGTPLADPDYWWHESWVPLASDGSGYIVAACDLGGPDAAPLLRIEWGPDVDHEPRADSFGQLVEWWIEAIEIGQWIYDHDRDAWTRTTWTPELQRRYRGLI
jgi:cell wall assembly regulator SMI1